MMKPDVFGDLRDWTGALEILEGLKRSGKLDDHQTGLARILESRDNWKLRDSALEALKALKRPSDEVLASAVWIMMDDEVYVEARALAADAVGHMARLRGSSPPSGLTREAVAGKMRNLLRSPQASLLHDVLRRSLVVVEEP